MILSQDIAAHKHDISVIICFHNEGFIAKWTLDGVQRMRAYGESNGFQTELICVLDRADAKTIEIVSGHQSLRPIDRVIHVDNGGPASSRNAGVSIARGEFIAVIDGDDYCSENWLAAAAKAACAEQDPVIFHPDFIVSFGEAYSITKATDMRQRKYDMRSCLKIHPWLSTVFGKKEVFLNHPFRPTDVRSTGFGYEDWDWNLSLVAEGYLHLSITDTALFYRKKQVSVQTLENQYKAVVRPNRFFNADFQRRLLPTLNGSVKMHEATDETRPYISVVICFHNEDFIAGWTLDTVQRMRTYAEANGFQTELICILDRADLATTIIVSGHACLSPIDRVIEVENGDLGTNRNSGVAIARGEFIAILDGDDYYSENWLAAAAKAAHAEEGKAIFHPEFDVSFGEIYAFTKITDMRQQKYDLRSCLTTHPWVSTAFGRKDIFLSHPYQSTYVRRTGFGYEDWEWNLRLIAAGYIHLSVQDTAKFYRRKRVSMLIEMDALKAVVRPNPFFDAEFQRRLLPTCE